MVDVISRPGPQVTASELHDLLRLRVDVFVVEQECPYPEVDGLDLLPSTTHVWATREGELACTLRLLDPHGPEGALVVGRVVTAPGHRGAGLAGDLMRWVLEQHGQREIELEGQSHLVGWYERFGFTPAGAELVIDGIPHTPMRRPAGGDGSA
ncbi:GNAT family N-acetyltransferase [Kytococcus sedentarius]|uniref:GNAT family N-acetyltransferase n=1 Tax=Kytococcus sedentarius TaxID=1276 RepID=UPI0035BBDDE4